jgi:ATP-dependent helicase HrpA
VVSVEGRGYPVELRYRPPEAALDDDGELAPEPLSMAQAIVAAADEITRQDPLGDVLVFLPGEREIRDAHAALARRKYRATEVIPLYARLSVRDQDKVFNPGPGRRIVLATNVAETSLTVPRIRYVIDPGLARVKRYACTSNPSARPAPTSARAAAGASPPAFATGSIRKAISTAARATPTRRSCAHRWPA